MPTPRTVTAVPAIVLATMLFGTIAIVCSPLDRNGRIADWCAFYWAAVVARAAGMRLTVHDAEAVDPAGSYVIVCNHLSHMDTIALYLSSPVPIRMLAKASLFKIPLFGWAMRSAGHIPVTRRSGSREDVKAMNRGVKRLTDRRQSVVVFTEGTRSRDGRLQPFKKGAFHLAKDFGLPILPVAIEGTRDVLPPWTLRFAKGEAQVTFLPAIDPKEKDVATLHDETRAAIVGALNETPADT